MKRLALLFFISVFTCVVNAQVTYYSFQSGNLTAVDVWTTDPSGTLLLGSATPTGTDNIVILNGREITISDNTKTFASVSIQEGATLSLGTTTGHNFTTITGRGTLKLESATMPAGNYTDFYSATGGTVEYSGAGTFNLPNLGTIRNLTISGTGVKVFANNWTLYENLRVNAGTLRIGNDATVRNITVNGDIYVESGATFDVRNGNNPLHQVNAYGSVINNGGTIDFINSALNYLADPTNGSAVLNMLGTSNSNIVADGVVELNRLIINKGTDKTFVVSVTSNLSGKFRLYGRNNLANNAASPYSAENPEIRNALWIRNGTLRLGFNVDIPSLTEGGGNFFIPSNAQLWVDGAEIDITTPANGTGNQALALYGTFRITDGMFDTQNGAGFVYFNSGVFIIEGGTCRMAQLRRSGAGPEGNFTSYIQSGGILIVDGDGENSNAAARFSIDKTESVFRMSGGILRVSKNNSFTDGGHNRGGIHIVSDLINSNVTGGTVEIIPDNADFSLHSTVPLYNVSVSNTGARAVNLRNPLTIVNNFTIGTDITFNTNNNDVTFGGSFTNTGTFNSGTSSITLNGSGNSNLSFNTAGTQVINNFTIAKTNALTDTIFVTNAAAVAFRTTGEFRLESGVLDYKTYSLNFKANVHVATRLGLPATGGLVLLDGAVAQSISVPISGSGAYIGKLTLQNANGISLSGNTLTISDDLRLEDGVFNIGTYGLYVYGALTTPGVFSVNEMIQTAGIASDGGLGRYVNANTTITYPIGVAGKYTPVTAVFSSYSDDGIVRINPVEGELQTLVRPDGSALTYYFRVRNSDFTAAPTVNYTFTYNAANIPGADNPDLNYVSGRVENTTRTSYGAAGVNVTGTTFFIPDQTVVDASFTAAAASKFVGTVPIFYSRGNMNSYANWSANTSWSNVSHTGAVAATAPTVGSIVQIGYGGSGNMNGSGGNTHWIDLNVSNVNIAELRFVTGPGVWPARLIMSATSTNLQLGKVSGRGTVMVENTAVSPGFDGDFGEFSSNANNEFNYYLASNRTLTLPTSITVYPTLRIEAGNNTNRYFTTTVDLTVLGAFHIDQGSTLLLNSAVGGGDIEVFGNNSRLGSGTTIGRIRFPSTGQNRTFTYHGNINFGTGANEISVLNGTPNGLEHRFRIGGSINQDGASSVINLWTNNTGGNNVILELIDENSGNSYTRTAGSALSAYRIVMNKGNSTASDFSMNSTYSVNGPNNGATKALEIKNGLFVHNTSSTITLSSGGSDFFIPSTGGLQVAAGTMQITGTTANGIQLDGLLRISGGNLTLGNNDGNDNNYIEYTASTQTQIDISSGTLTVGSQIRRGFLSTTGILHYNQTGGTVIVGRYEVPSNERATFEILNTGSSFTHTGGTLTIVREQPNANVAGFIFQPESSNATADIIIGNANTPASHTIDIDASKAIGSLIISNAPTSLTARLLINDLTVNTNLTIDAGSTFNTNGLDINIGGGFTNNGTFTGTGSTTTFNGAGAQAATFNSSTTFNELVVNKSGTVTFAGSTNPTVTDNLVITAGTLDDGGRTIVLQGNADIRGTHTSTGAGRILFQGSVSQEIIGNNVGQLGSIEINNANGVLQATNLQINGTSTLTNGIFNVEGFKLTFGENAAIGGTPSSTKMFRNDGSLNALGFKKLIKTGASDFTIPMGTSNKYTPVRFNFSSNSTAGEIGVKPISIYFNGATDGKDDILNYYWNVTSTGFTTYTVTHYYTYDQSDVQLNDIALESDYVGGRYYDALWTTDGTVNSATNVITFSGVNYLSGEYTAGDVNEFGVIPTYYSRSGKANITTTGALWVEADTWSTKEWSDPLHNDVASIPASAPSGNSVQIKSGHKVLVSANSQRASSIVLEGTLDLGTSFSHILGNVSGTGDLIIGSTTVVFPAGNFDSFTGNGGGTVRYNAAADVTLPPQSVYWNLEIQGANQRTLSAVDIIVNNNLSIVNTARFSANSRQISIKGNWINNSGNGTPFVAGTGTVIFNGTSNQALGGTSSTSFYNLKFNNAQTGNTLSSGITVTGTLTMQSGRLNLSGQTITLGTSASLSESPSNLIYGVTGSIVAARNLGTSPGNVAGLGFNISSTSVALGTTTITRKHSQRTENGLSSIMRYYSVSPTTNTGLNATVQFNYDDSEVVGGDDENTFVLYRKAGAGNWAQRGGTVDAVANKVTLSGIDAFSDWTVDEGSSLPVDLVGFSIETFKNRPLLKWETATEYENYGFYIERRFLGDSTKIDQWQELMFVEGKGTIYERQFYEFQDEPLGAAGKYEYRLKQMDFDGKTELFGPVEFLNRPPDHFNLDQNYPNPFNPTTKIPYQVAKNGNVKIVIYDILGRVVQTLKDEHHTAGSYLINFNASRLASGVYIIYMQADGYRFSKKMVLVK